MHGGDLLRQPALRLRVRGALLAAQGVGILAVAVDAVFAREVLGGLRHRVDAVTGLHARVDQAPAQRGVLELLPAGPGNVGLGHHVGRARHALDAAGDDQVGFAAGDRARGLSDRLQPGRAQPVDGDGGHAWRQAGQQRRHARHVAVVLAGLVGAAEDHLVQRGPVHCGMPRHQRRDRQRGQVVGAHAGQRAAEAAERRTRRIDQPGASHKRSSSPCAAASHRAGSPARSRAAPRAAPATSA